MRRGEIIYPRASNRVIVITQFQCPVLSTHLSRVACRHLHRDRTLSRCTWAWRVFNTSMFPSCAPYERDPGVTAHLRTREMEVSRVASECGIENIAPHLPPSWAPATEGRNALRYCVVTVLWKRIQWRSAI